MDSDLPAGLWLAQRLNHLCTLADMGHGSGEDGMLIDPADVREALRHFEHLCVIIGR